MHSGRALCTSRFQRQKLLGFNISRKSVSSTSHNTNLTNHLLLQNQNTFCHRYVKISEISCSHCSEYDDGCLLGCGIMHGCNKDL